MPQLSKNTVKEEPISLTMEMLFYWKHQEPVQTLQKMEDKTLSTQVMYKTLWDPCVLIMALVLLDGFAAVVLNKTWSKLMPLHAPF